jgi:IS5 family transposase
MTITATKQVHLGLNLSTRRTRKREALPQMDCVVPSAALVGLVAAHAAVGKADRPPFPVEAMLRIHFMRQ